MGKRTQEESGGCEETRDGREDAVINRLVKPSGLIINESGRYVFDKENIRMRFDVIDWRF